MPVYNDIKQLYYEKNTKHEHKVVMSIAKTLAENTREFRTRKGLTQAQLAEKANLAIYSIQAMESGRRWPVKKTFQAVARALDIEEDLLFASEQQFIINTKPTKEQLIQYIAKEFNTPTPSISEQLGLNPPPERKDKFEKIVKILAKCSENRFEDLASFFEPDINKMEREEELKNRKEAG